MISTPTDRAVSWDGFHNTRDLGGLPTRDGRRTRFGAYLRAADLRFVSPDGWRAAYAAGVRTVLDLRNDDEVRPVVDGPTAAAGSAQLPPAGPAAGPGMTRIQVPLDGVEDVEFWRRLNEERLNGTPLYYRPFLDRRPDRCAAVVTALGTAAEGGTIFHCGAGRDRTGLVALLLLALVGVPPADIPADYDRTLEPLRDLYAALGRTEEGQASEAAISQALADYGTTAAAAIEDLLDGFDVEAYLRDAGVPATAITTIRARLLG